MDMQKIESSNITEAGYDAATRTLRIKFKNGKTYDYSDVGELVYAGFCKTYSKGKFFFANIKGKFECEKLEETATD